MYGYFLLGQNKIDLAIEKFKKQVSLAPNNANSYDSLGDGYRAAKEYKKAAKQYRIAIKIDPTFKASKEN